MSTPSTTLAVAGTLFDVIPAGARKAIYSAFGSLGVAVGGIEVAFAAAGHGQPTWLTVATAVLVFLGIPVSATALLHVPAALPEILPQVVEQAAPITINAPGLVAADPAAAAATIAANLAQRSA